MTFERGDVVVVPFPFTDKEVNRRRPALVLSAAEPFGNGAAHVVLAMITRAKSSEWPLDVPVSDLEDAGLKHECRVRMKLFTLDERLVIRKTGRLSDRDLATTDAALDRLFGR